MILGGKKLSKQILLNIKTNIEKYKLSPGLAVILIGKNPSSLMYIKLKQRAAKKIGINFKKFALSSKTSQKRVLNLIEKLNKNKKIQGIIIQMPLAKHLNPELIIKAISLKKDVDGFRPQSKFISPTHQGIIKLLKASKKSLKNKKGLILSKNPVFTQPLEKLLKKQGIKTKILYPKKQAPVKEIKKTDILIVALGKPKFIKPQMVKKNLIIIDVGYNRVKGQAIGDVDPKIKQKTSYLSPVPGGLGPLTVAYLLRNVYLAAKK